MGIQAWMDNVSGSLENRGASISSLAERKIFIENLRSHQKEFEDWASIINKFKESQFGTSENVSGEDSNILLDTINKYNEIKEMISSTIDEEEGFALKHEEWLQSSETAKEWIDENNMKLRSLSSAALQRDGNLTDLKENLLPEFLSELEENEVMLESLEEGRVNLEGALSENARSIVSSCNDEIKAKYTQMIEDVNALDKKVTRALEEATENPDKMVEISNVTDEENEDTDGNDQEEVTASITDIMKTGQAISEQLTSEEHEENEDVDGKDQEKHIASITDMMKKGQAESQQFTSE